MSAKIGRPLSDNPKSTRIGIRLDEEHLAILEDYYNKLSKTKSEIVRDRIDLVAEKLPKSK